MIRKLKAVDSTLAVAYSDRIEVLQEALEKIIQVTQDAIRQREEAAQKAEQLEEQRRAIVAEEARKRKQEEEDRKLAAEAAIKKEREVLLQKVKDLAASDPQLLAEAGITARIKCSIPKSILMLYNSAQPTRLLQVANATLVQQKAQFASDLPDLPATSVPNSTRLVQTLVSSIVHPSFQT